MSDILSQDELDALLAEVKSASSEDEAEEEAPRPPARRAPAPASRPPAAAAPPSADGDAGDEPVPRNLDLILTLPLELSVELGRTRMSIFELLQLGQGSVIELDRMASDLIDLTVNRRCIAQGEAVVVNESFGFRVVEVDSVRDRIRKL